MISPNKINNFFKAKSTSKDINYFFKTHIYLEAYLKRVYLIGLRLRNVQYENSEKIISSTYMKTPQLINKIMWLLDTKNISKTINKADFKKNYPQLEIHLEVVLKFSSLYRNQLAHGTIDDIEDQKTIDWLCHTNISFVSEFEDTLKRIYSHSAFDKPSDWGAKRGNAESIPVTAARLGLGKVLSPPMNISSVKKKLSSTSYSTP